MQQLGASFVQSFLVPYIKNNILGNVDKDERLQREIRFDTVPSPTDIDGLETSYFTNTGTVLDTDMALRKVFFNEFIEFINRQKNIANGNVYQLAFRLLPDAKTKTYSKDATNNLEKFGFEAAKAMEDHVAAELIRQKEANGEIKKEQAEDDRRKLKEGKLILVRGKDSNFKYKSEDDIKRAIASREKAIEFWDDVLADDSPQGPVAYGMNPLEIPEQGKEEKGSTLAGLQKQVWTGIAIKAEKELENNGIYVEARLKVDQNGVAYGTVQDRRGVALKGEVSVIKPGKRNYKFTFANQPSKKFFVNQDELKTEFKDKKHSANEVYANKQISERKREELITRVGIPAKGGVQMIPKTPKVAFTQTEAGQTNTPANQQVYEGPVPIGVQAGKRASVQTEQGAGAVPAGYPSGPIEAKEAFEQKRLAQETEVNAGSGSRLFKSKKAQQGGLQSGSRLFRNSPIGRVMKYYAATAAGFGGALGFYIFS